jgi:molybdopterin molybdotransferase
MQLVRPVIRAMLGLPRPFSPVIEAVLAAPIRKRPGRALLARARLDREVDGVIRATPARSQSSGAMSGMVEADGLVILPLEAGDAAAGETVRVQVLRWRFMDRAEPGYWREVAEAEAPERSTAPSSTADDACC